MTSLPAVLALGCLLGMRHAMDPDHVVAVSTIVSREQSAKRALRIGAMWGLGHSLVVALVGALMTVGGVMISPKLSAFFELGVAVMLLVLGVHALRPRVVPVSTGHRMSVTPDARTTLALRSMVVGVVHGLAGSAAVTLLVLASIHNTQWAFVYLCLFAVGTVIGMMSLTALFFLSMSAAMRRFARLDLLLPRVTGTLSIVCGLCVAAKIAHALGIGAQ
jgi:high-affinity nickel-transport protein